MAVIGFLRYQDFLAEVVETPLWGNAIRVQDYQKAVSAQDFPLETITAWVECAVEADEDILFCRFKLGQTQVYAVTGHEAPDREREEKLTTLEHRAQRAAQILKNKLVDTHGLAVGAGLIALSTPCEITTTWPPFWSKETLEPNKEAINV